MSAISPKISNVPKTLHTSVRDALWDRIESGQYPPGSQIPSEAALCDEFRVSRITIRHALGDLHRLGHIFKIHGKGTFVSRPRPLQHFAPVLGFGEAMSRAGYDVVSKLLSLEQIPASNAIAARLGIAEREPIYEMRRLRYLERQAVRLDILCIPAALGGKLVGVDLSRRDVFSYFENELGIEIGDSVVELEAASADAAIARQLGVSLGAPVLRIEWLAYRRDGTPLDFAQIYCRGDVSRYRFWAAPGPTTTR